MADRYGDRIGSIIRSGHGCQVQDAANHIHDLLLLRPTIAHNGLLDLKGRVFVNLQSAAIGTEQGNTASLRNGNTGSDIRIEKELFNGHAVRLEMADQLFHIRIDLIQP